MDPEECRSFTDINMKTYTPDLAYIIISLIVHHYFSRLVCGNSNEKKGTQHRTKKTQSVF